MEFKVVYLSRYLGAGKDAHQPIHTRLQMARIIAVAGGRLNAKRRGKSVTGGRLNAKR